MSDSSCQPVLPVDPRYPIGRWQRPEVVDPSTLSGALLDLGELPGNLRNAVDDMDNVQLATPYRAGGWTVRQLVNHVADSHMNCYIRFKWALTEDAPTIKAYDETAWAELHDGEAAPIEWSLDLLDALHARLLMLLRSLTPEQWQRTFVHPEHGPMRLDEVATMYAWHSRHHVAHITHLRAEKGW